MVVAWRRGSLRATTARVLRIIAPRISARKRSGIGWLARLARGHIGEAEFLQRLEDAGLQQRQEIVELDQVVLHRRRRQQEQEALVERVDELPALTRSVAQMVRLVDDDEIELALDEALGVLAPPCGGDRGDDAILGPKRLRLVAQERVVGGREGKTEFGLQLFAPLTDERSRREHQACARPCRAAHIP